MKAKKVNTKTTIGVFSASSPISATVPVRYERGKKFLEGKGFRVFNGELYGKRDFYRSGTIKERANEWNQLLYQDEIQIIMASIGGNNTNAILPYIDYEYLKKHPKIIIGYSDTTALLLAIYAKTGLVTFYGPALASSFGELPPFVDLTYKNFEDIVCGNISIPYQYPMPAIWTDEFINWSEQDRGKEERENHWVCVNGGIILGKHEKFDDNGTGRKPYEILQEVLDGRKVPLLAEFDCCHTHPMLTMPIGCMVELNATEKKVTLMEEPLD